MVYERNYSRNEPVRRTTRPGSGDIVIKSCIRSDGDCGHGSRARPIHTRPLHTRLDDDVDPPRQADTTQRAADTGLHHL
eukprot:2341095-Prymnesium_polylepis.1